jgi:UDPglucose--hexose-1-phosphate uridylyltransferase
MAISLPSEMRLDPFMLNWVIVAPERNKRPHAAEASPRPQPRPSFDHSCAFCPGNEAETPPEIWRLADECGQWRVRVIPNKFAVLADGNIAGQPAEHGSERLTAMPGHGRHEIVIESPDHAMDLSTANHAQIRDVLAAYRARYGALSESGAALVVIFRNHGQSAGASLAHPHSQIVATPVVPLDVRHRCDVAAGYFNRVGRSLYLDVLRDEIDDGRRIVMASDRYIAFEPFASASPFETWIMPRARQASFGAVTDADLDNLAAILRAVLAGVRDALDDPDYNYVIQSAPLGEENRESFSWFLRLVPRLTTPAGFELGTGMHVNPTPPEESAAVLRRTIASIQDSPR